MTKQDEPMTPHTLATLQREAQSAARRLARSLNLCREAEADICQDLLADLLSRIHRFDPDRGTLGAFAGRIVANQASCIAKQIQREHREGKGEQGRAHAALVGSFFLMNCRKRPDARPRQFLTQLGQWGPTARRPRIFDRRVNHCPDLTLTQSRTTH
jgi:DNA-directed RNA polymerase specialized sigma24 family protein